MYKKSLLNLLIALNSSVLFSSHPELVTSKGNDSFLLTEPETSSTKEIILPKPFEVKTSTKLKRALVGAAGGTALYAGVGKLCRDKYVPNDTLGVAIATLGVSYLAYTGYNWLTGTEKLLKNSDRWLGTVSNFEIIQNYSTEPEEIAKRANEIYNTSRHTYRYTEKGSLSSLFPLYAAHLRLESIERDCCGVLKHLKAAKKLNTKNNVNTTALDERIKTSEAFMKRAETMKSALSTHDDYKKDVADLRYNHSAAFALGRFFNYIQYT